MKIIIEVPYGHILVLPLSAVGVLDHVEVYKRSGYGRPVTVEPPDRPLDVVIGEVHLSQPTTPSNVEAQS